MIVFIACYKNKQVLVNRPPDEGEARRAIPPPLLFLKSYFAKDLFFVNLLLCHSPRHPKLFWPRHSQGLIGDPSEKDI